jgi:hypothetical protein
VLAPMLQRLEIEHCRQEDQADTSPHAFYLRALTLFRTSNQDNELAIRLLRRALDRDPLNAPAHAMLGRCSQFQRLFGWRTVENRTGHQYKRNLRWPV